MIHHIFERAEMCCEKHAQECRLRTWPGGLRKPSDRVPVKLDGPVNEKTLMWLEMKEGRK